MEQGIEIRFPQLSNKEKALLIGAVYRQSLVEVGHSPDFHVYDLDRGTLERKRHLASARFLLQVMDFYDGLPEFERKIFLCECLESGRHYAFWWLDFGDKRRFYRATHLLLRKTSADF
jgi:hypothetical protein